MDQSNKSLEQGLDEENLKYEDHFLNFFMSIKDKVRIEDLFIAQNYHMSDNSKGYFPISIEKLKEENRQLYDVVLNTIRNSNE